MCWSRLFLILKTAINQKMQKRISYHKHLKISNLPQHVCLMTRSVGFWRFWSYFHHRVIHFVPSYILLDIMGSEQAPLSSRWWKGTLDMLFGSRTQWTMSCLTKGLIRFSSEASTSHPFIFLFSCLTGNSNLDSWVLLKSKAKQFNDWLQALDTQKHPDMLAVLNYTEL